MLGFFSSQKEVLYPQHIKYTLLSLAKNGGVVITESCFIDIAPRIMANKGIVWQSKINSCKEGYTSQKKKKEWELGTPAKIKICIPYDKKVTPRNLETFTYVLCIYIYIKDRKHLSSHLLIVTVSDVGFKVLKYPLFTDTDFPRPCIHSSNDGCLSPLRGLPVIWRGLFILTLRSVLSLAATPLLWCESFVNWITSMKHVTSLAVDPLWPKTFLVKSYLHS